MTASAALRLPVTAIRAIGLVLMLGYAGVVVWMYAKQPKTIAEVTGGLTASVALYRIDQASFDAGLAFFHKDQFAEARTALERADPAKQHGVTQFYIAYSYVRQGWGRVYADDELYTRARVALQRAVEVSPGGKVQVDNDSSIALKSSDELKAEIDRGLTREAADFNPFRVFDKRP
jgi:tetratricopeptide (TPR) repeat protein